MAEEFINVGKINELRSQYIDLLSNYKKSFGHEDSFMLASTNILLLEICEELKKIRMLLEPKEKK